MHRTVMVLAWAWRMALDSASRSTTAKQFSGPIRGRMLGQNLKLNLRTAVRACAFDDRRLHGEVGRIVVERVDAGAHELERLVNGVFDVGEIGGNAGLVGMDHAQGFGLKRSA